MTDHGAGTIKEWMRDLVETARSGADFETSAGAEPGRSYAYLEFHLSDERHSILLFRVEEPDGGRPCVRAYRFDGSAVEVRERVDDLVHDRAGGGGTAGPAL